MLGLILIKRRHFVVVHHYVLVYALASPDFSFDCLSYFEPSAFSSFFVSPFVSLAGATGFSSFLTSDLSSFLASFLSSFSFLDFFFSARKGYLGAGSSIRKRLVFYRYCKICGRFCICLYQRNKLLYCPFCSSVISIMPS